MVIFKIDNTEYTEKDFGLVMIKRTIGMPEVKTIKVDIPGRNGLVDLTDSFFGVPRYNNRTITIEFQTFDLLSEKNWAETFSGISNILHGVFGTLRFTDDTEYYYSGRFEVRKVELDRSMRNVTVVMDCAPFKMKDKQTVVMNPNDTITIKTGRFPTSLRVEREVDQSVLTLQIEVDGDQTYTYNVTGPWNVFPSVLAKPNTVANIKCLLASTVAGTTVNPVTLIWEVGDI